MAATSKELQQIRESILRILVRVDDLIKMEEKDSSELIENLTENKRLVRLLKRHNILTVSDVIDAGKIKLRYLPMMGDASIAELINLVENHGKKLGL
jgi:DNA-directed RNA polymerase alpha subunit